MEEEKKVDGNAFIPLTNGSSQSSQRESKKSQKPHEIVHLFGKNVIAQELAPFNSHVISSSSSTTS